MQWFYSRQPYVLTLVLVSVFGWCQLSAAEPQSISNPPTVVTNIAGKTVLIKDLNFDSNYGVADGAADIVYTGQTGTWTFVLSAAGLNATDYSSAKVIMTLVLDDHTSRSTTLYSMKIAVPSGTAFNGNTDLLGMPHGQPLGGTPFVNWTNSTFTSSLVPDSFTVSLQNTSSTISSDWIGIDKIQIELTAVPEPSTLSLLTVAIMVGFGRRLWTRKVQAS